MAGVGGTAPVQAAAPSPELEQRLSDVESRLAALGNALRARDPAGIDLHAAELHRALASAVTQFTDAAKSGRVPADLRTRLVAQVPPPPAELFAHVYHRPTQRLREQAELLQAELESDGS